MNKERTGFKDFLGNDLHEGDLVSFTNWLAFAQSQPTMVGKIEKHDPGGLIIDGQKTPARLLITFEISITAPRTGPIAQLIRVVNPASEKLVNDVLDQPKAVQ